MMQMAKQNPLNRKGNAFFPFGFPISQAAWQHYGISDVALKPKESEASPEGFALRVLADRINHEGKIPAPVYAGQLMTLGLILDIQRFLIDLYCTEQCPKSLEDGVEHVRQTTESDTVDRTTQTFAALYPPLSVHRGLESTSGFLAASFEDRPNSLRAAVEIVLLRLTMENPALEHISNLFDDSELKAKAPYLAFIASLETFFSSRAPVRLLGQSLFEALRAPMRASPRCIEGQLDYILSHWSPLIPEHFRRRLLVLRGVLREEIRMRGPVDGAAEVLTFPGFRRRPGDADYAEPERFSRDLDWMSNVCLIAKSTYVWLDQLSKKYGRKISRLDQIPNEELDRLATWGFTGLWLIGVWERSKASRQIKQAMGNPDAIASAYSLYDYTIAEDLGGEAAYEELRRRAWSRGIRLASDMVPNHVGIDSRWVVQHPDWFIQSSHPPFPGYRFSGQDLCSDSRVSVHIEDGYWNHRDASVVFKRVDNHTGSEIFIYHGNDGTHLPWNDTAQLDYRNPEVREAVIQTILHVARQFPIIRFDAAMTLAKKHYQRLWFPLPGEGGAIPSRSEYSMTRDEFDAQIPAEFWREVVDRVAQEAPDTLLLAEAFWLMEGYFVRTLGMHRVYNSAFMNMLKREDNDSYRLTLKNVLEFSPEVLKRFVNFMNNPDEKTAVEQFGKEDKYFGVAMMMATMPGLPMFGHGQVEGFTEQYGMEYPRAYWDEAVDEEMVRRHEREIFPLMHKRYLFSRAENFALFDFETPEGPVNENVFAYSNCFGDERALVVYNNAYGSTCGWIRRSTAINVARNGETHFIHKTLAQALALRTDEGTFYLFRDHRTNLEYLRRGSEIAAEGLYAETAGYEYHVFLDFQQIHDGDGSWAEVARRLDGKGTPSIEKVRREVALAPILNAFENVIAPDMLRCLAESMRESELDASLAHRRFRDSLDEMLQAVGRQSAGVTLDREEIFRPAETRLNALQTLDTLIRKTRLKAAVKDYLLAPLGTTAEPAFWESAAIWAILHSLEPLFATDDRGVHWLDHWLLSPVVTQSLVQLNHEPSRAHLETLRLKAMLDYAETFGDSRDQPPSERLRELLNDPDMREYLQVNEYEGVLWFNKEQFQALAYWLFLTSTLNFLTDPKFERTRRNDEIQARFQNLNQVLEAAKESGYRIESTLSLTAQKRKRSPVSKRSTKKSTPMNEL